MNNIFTSLKQQIAGASTTSKIVVVAALLVLVAVFAVMSNLASRPSFVLLYSGLDAQHAATVQSALATANVRYQVSQPPAPFVIHIDESQFYAGQNAVALSGALDRAPEGIQTNGSGAAQVFLSAGERAQNVLKREWQELEKQLEELDFVQRARVSTSTPDPSPLRKSAPMTVAVTLTLKGAELTRAQGATVAKLVRYRFNVPADSVVVSDQSGRSLFDGSSMSDSAQTATDLLDHRRRHDDDLASKTNQVLDRVFGPGIAYVVVNSDWTYEQLESVKETLDPKNKVVVSETANKTTTPQGSSSGAGGIAGSASNLASEFGATNAAVPSGGAKSATEDSAQTSESQKSTIVGKETSLKTSTAPKLAKMSVSLFLDESQKERLKDLEASVKTSVGFDDKRGDSFSSMVSPFASVKRDDAGKIVVPEPPKETSAPSRMTEMLVERSVEIAAALVFLFVLMKALKGARAGSVAAAGATPEGIMPDEHTLELMAKSEIEELVKTDPERVSSILSRWAAEREPAAAKR
jgi:flagellar M-ring protein FliF